MPFLDKSNKICYNMRGISKDMGADDEKTSFRWTVTNSRKDIRT